MKGGGEGGIRTHGPSRVNGFQDRRNRPLCHLSDRMNCSRPSLAKLASWANCAKLVNQG